MNTRKQSLSVSIVIPVYNEAAHLPACLDAIARQTIKPLEVIVVDNNSSDDTASLAEQYDFVRLIYEPRQGVVYARDRGFNAARGAVIGRIDADTLLSENWVETLQGIFADELVGAVTGSVRYYDMALSPVMNRVDLHARRYFARVLGREVAMQGANMAVRQSVWRHIRHDLCRTGGMHEDFDLAIHTNHGGHHVVFEESLVASLKYRQAESCFVDFVDYVLLSPRTYAVHGLKSRLYMYPVVWLAISCYLPLKLLHRGYDTKNERFSWIRLFQDSQNPRVNPATFVD